ncbi:MAG TPA: glycosyltransferase family 2 protein [Candidatus Paceibacterota bacterium]
MEQASKKNEKLKSVSFFCPAYHDELNLPELIPQVFNFLEKNTEKFEIVIIEDCSPDSTGQVADDLATKFPHIRVVHHNKNQGITATMKEGFNTARYEYVMYTDGDNQYNIWDFEPYLNLLKTNDVIAGYAIKKAVSKFRVFQSNLHNFLINILFFVNFKDINCSMKIFKKSVLDSIDICSSSKGGFIDAELILKAKKLGYKIAQFPVVHYERRSGIAGGTKPKVVLNTIKDMIMLRLNLL